MSSSSSDSSSNDRAQEQEMYDDDLKKKLRYEQLITICFWLSVDQGILDIANMILEQDKLIQMLVANVFGRKDST